MWPQTQPVTAPNAPVSDAREEQARAEQAPLRLDADRCGAPAGPGSASGASTGGGGGVVLRRTEPIGGVVVVVLLDDRLVRGGVEQVAERAVLGGEPAARALLHDATRLEDGDLLGALGRREPVGDEDAGAPRDQPVGGAYDAGLGDRVHPGGGLVEDDDADVAHQQPRERDELLLARRTGWCRPGRGRCRGRRAARRPTRSGRARRPPPRSRARGTSPKRVMFSARVPARTSVRWVTTPTAARSCCRSRSSTSMPPSSTVPRGGSTARESSEARVDLPEPVRPTSAQVCPAGTRRSTSRRANVPVP